MSLIKSKDALKQYNTRKDLEIEKSDEVKGNHSRKIQTITDHNFCHNFEDMIEIFKPLHNCQVMSKLSDVHLGYVVQK